MTRRFSRLESRILNKPLMIEPSAGEVVLSAIGERLGLEVKAEDVSEAQERESRSYAVVDGVAVIPVLGELVRRGSWIDALSGLTSYASIAANFDKALHDTRVRAILLDIDSPGGEAGGVMELSDRIYNARGTKPIYASVNELAASAAYAIASAADKVFVSRTGTTGSIGVIAYHVDRTEADAKAGLKYTPIFAGDRKADLSPHAPLSDEARSWIEEDVQAHYELFVNTVARNRNLDAAAVKGTEAGLFMGEAGIKAGLADEIATFEEAFARIVAEDQEDEDEDDMDENEIEEAVDVAAPKAEVDTSAILAQASAIASLCTKAGIPDQASRLIQEGVSLDEAKAFIEQRAAVEEVFKASAKMLPLDDTKRASLVASCKTPDEARKAVFELMASADEELEIDTAPPRAGSPLSVKQTAEQVVDLYGKWADRKAQK